MRRRGREKEEEEEACGVWLDAAALKRRKVQKKGVKKHVAAKSSRSSKISFSKYKTANLCIPEKQPMLSSIDELSESSSLERSYISFSSENVIRFSNLEKSTIPSSTERFKPSSREKSSKSSSPKKVSRSSHLGKSYRKQSLDKPHKQAYAHKLGSQVHSTHLNRAVMPPSPATLQYPFWPTEQPYPNSPQNKILLLKSSSLQKFTKPPKHTNPKSSVSTGMANRLPRSKLVNSCSYYKEKCPDCISTSKPLVNDISEAKKTNVQNSSFPCEVKPLFKYLHKVDSRHNALNDNVNDSDMMTYVSDNDLEREITIICNINLGEVIHNGTPRNEEFNKNKNYL
ncbi:uncharacterized protein CXorf66 homolog [Rhynchonycteris naso]